MLEQFFNDKIKIKFQNRPIAVPYDYRIIYKVSQIVLIIGTVCKRGGCSSIKLHILSNALTSSSMLDELEKLFDNKIEIIPIVRFEQAVTRAVNFAIADKLIEIQSSNLKLKLTAKGRQLYEEIMNDDSIMVLEKEELNRVKDKIKDDVINRIVEKWGQIKDARD